MRDATDGMNGGAGRRSTTAAIGRLLAACVVGAACMAEAASATSGAEPPNVVLVITDDQGYGDLACHGNPVVRTPHLDKLAGEASQLSDYHVAPTCSPTRAALLTGRWTNRTGAWHTINGRSMLRDDEVTLAQMLQRRGYATGLFGKWHLGDNYPYRAEDRGFEETFRHGGGGVGQTPDLWDNAYFDGRYFHNGKIAPANGFCTDVFFEQASRFIRESVERKRPFFAYIAPNAPHGPLHAPQKYLDLYAGRSPELAAFYGMITNIDDNVGRLRELLAELQVERETILIFTTDNGTAGGAQVFNAGMRGAKGSEYDGGHRVPLLVRWPAGGLDRRHVSDELAHAVDIVPTLLEWTGAAAPEGVKLDGRSIRRLLDPAAEGEWPDRMLITDSQRVRDPIKWKQSAVMSRDWRLVNGRELYAIKRDPGQQRDLAAEHPEQVAKMRAFYDAWWDELEPTFARTTEIYLGAKGQPTASLTAHDWIHDDSPPWHQGQIRQALGWSGARPAGRAKPGAPRAKPATSERPAPAGDPNATPPARTTPHRGHWAVKVVTTGDYRIELRRWPAEADRPIAAGLPAEPDVPGADRALRTRPGVAVPVETAVLRIDDRELARQPVPEGARQVSFTTRLEAGSHRLAPLFLTADGDELGAYYVVVTHLTP